MGGRYCKFELINRLIFDKISFQSFYYSLFFTDDFRQSFYFIFPVIAFDIFVYFINRLMNNYEKKIKDMLCDSHDEIIELNNVDDWIQQNDVIKLSDESDD